MRKTREEKAITLIALIITIVVLLILAVVAINAVTGDGIIQHAVNAKTSYENAQAKEEDILSYYQEYLNAEGNLGPWKQVGDNITMEDDEGNLVEIPVGAKVNYTPELEKTYTSYSSKTGIEENQTFTTTGDDLNWRVIGVENKKILLMAVSGVTPGGTGAYLLSGNNGYNNGVQELNDICSIYGTGYGAESARSLNEDDIDKIAGLTEEIKKSESEANMDSITAPGVTNYRAKYVYKYDGSRLTFAKNNGAEDEITGESGNKSTYFPDSTVLGSLGTEGEKEVQASYVRMDISDNNKLNQSLKEELLSEDSKWVASKSIGVNNETYNNLEKGYVMWGLKALINTNGTILFGSTLLYNSHGKLANSRSDLSVCPIVRLKADVTLTEGENGAYNINLNKN